MGSCEGIAARGCAGRISRGLTEHRSTRLASYQYDADDELLQVAAPGNIVTTYGYDAAGNEIAAGSTQFDYDLGNRLIGATVRNKQSTYAYDGNGKRLAVGLSGRPPKTRFVWDSNSSLPRLALARTATGKEQQRFLYAGGPGGGQRRQESSGITSKMHLEVCGGRRR